MNHILNDVLDAGLIASNDPDDQLISLLSCLDDPPKFNELLVKPEMQGKLSCLN